jgi:hypothetical protein
LIGCLRECSRVHPDRGLVAKPRRPSSITRSATSRGAITKSRAERPVCGSPER